MARVCWLRSSFALILMVTSFATSAHATRITTGDLSDSNTAINPLVSSIGATPAATIRFDVGGASFVTSSGQLSVSISVDALVPTVTSGTAADQLFRDESVGAAYFGYYLSTGVKTASQGASNVNIKIRKGSAETSGRSYYLLGNGTSTPAAQGDLTLVPASFTTFASVTSNTSHCGPNYVANGLTGVSINCSGGSTVPNMDVTQYVKVLDSDPTSGSIISQVEFIAVSE